ncbi:MAG TPA: YncE family protein [Terriglobales bacterium]|nr:YncE family protein [Terriglobales bacterium]
MYCSRKAFSCVSILTACCALLALIACGGSNTSSGSSSSTLSKFKKRILVLNSQAVGVGLTSVIYIFNAENNLVFQTPISLTTDAYNLMTETPDKKTVLVYSSLRNNSLLVVDTATEKATASFGLGDSTDKVVVMSDNKTAVAAVRNLPVTNKPNGAVLLADITTAAVTATISVPEARRVAINHAGTKVLAFADDTDSVYVIDTTAKTATPIAGFDRPVDAVFSSDDSKAYILNCGAECGGTTASVTVLNTSDNSLGANVPVNGATVGLLDGTKLYVAGSPSGTGQLDVVDTSSMTRTTSGVAIANGHHDRMVLVGGNKLYVGSTSCTVSNGKGCLSIFATSGNTAVIPTTSSPGSVTGIQEIAGRNLVFVSIGGELVKFDSTTDAPSTSNQIDIVGKTEEILAID